MNDDTTKVKLENHQPIQNHNKIVQAMGQTSESYLTILAANDVQLENMEVILQNLKRIDELILQNQEKLRII